jgi:hypothetical protein
MQDDFVEVYSKTTGAKQMVPPHFIDHPVLGKDFTPTSAGREVLALSDGAPSLSWTREQLDDHAAALGIDGSALSNKGEVLAAIDGTQVPQSTPESGSTGPGAAAAGGEDNPDNDPANGDEE